jgi:hypothetical protein
MTTATAKSSVLSRVLVVSSLPKAYGMPDTCFCASQQSNESPIPNRQSSTNHQWPDLKISIPYLVVVWTLAARDVVRSTPGPTPRLSAAHRDTPEAYRYFTPHRRRSWPPSRGRRWPIHARLIFTAFAMRLSPARRMLYAFGVAALLVGLLRLFRGVGKSKSCSFRSRCLPALVWAPGTMWMFSGSRPSTC